MCKIATSFAFLEGNRQLMRNLKRGIGTELVLYAAFKIIRSHSDHDHIVRRCTSHGTILRLSRYTRVYHGWEELLTYIADMPRLVCKYYHP